MEYLKKHVGYKQKTVAIWQINVMSYPCVNSTMKLATIWKEAHSHFHGVRRDRAECEHYLSYSSIHLWHKVGMVKAEVDYSRFCLPLSHSCHQMRWDLIMKSFFFKSQLNDVLHSHLRFVENVQTCKINQSINFMICITPLKAGATKWLNLKSNINTII